MPTFTVRLDRKTEITFNGTVLVDVCALNHDDAVRRRFRVYSTGSEFIAERIDDPDTIDVRFWGAQCADSLDLYQFFGTEPLANYLYGRLELSVPGLRSVDVKEST